MPTTPPELIDVALFAGALREARHRRDEAIRDALSAGHRHDDVANAAGLSGSAVRKIRNEFSHAETVEQ